MAIAALRQISSLAPQLTGELTRISLFTLFLVCTLTAAFSAINHQLVYSMTGATPTSPTQLLAMFTGDTLGSLLMLYAVASLLRLARHAAEDAPLK
jgi:hypothetical protein